MLFYLFCVFFFSRGRLRKPAPVLLPLVGTMHARRDG